MWSLHTGRNRILFKKSILFPLPTAMNNHQYLNAMQFKKNNECLVFNEERLKIKITIKKN